MQRTVDEVFAAYGDRIFAAAFSVCRNRADADDVVQDTLVRYYTHPREFDSEDHLKAWLLRVAINRARDLSTSFWRKHTVAWEEYMNDLAFEEPQDSHLFEAVMRLPAKYRAAPVLLRRLRRGGDRPHPAPARGHCEKPAEPRPVAP